MTEKAVYHDYEGEILLISRADCVDMDGERCWSICAGRQRLIGDTEEKQNSIELILTDHQFRMLMSAASALVSESKNTDLNNLIVDCSYHEGSYLVERKDADETEMIGLEFRKDRDPLRFYHIKK